MVYVLMVCLGSFFVIQRAREFFKVRSKIKDGIIHDHSLKTIAMSKFVMLAYLVAIVILGLLIYRKIQQAGSFSFETFLVLYCFSEYLNAYTYQTFYYNQKGFYFTGRFVPYKDVKETKDKQLLFHVYSIQLKNDEGFSVSKKAFEVIEDKVKSK